MKLKDEVYGTVEPQDLVDAKTMGHLLRNVTGTKRSYPTTSRWEEIGVVAPVFDTLGCRGRQISKFKVSLLYRVSSRIARATQRSPVSKSTKPKRGAEEMVWWIE